MKLALIFIAVLLTGCAGLSINFDASISYRSDVPYQGRSDPPTKPASGI